MYLVELLLDLRMPRVTANPKGGFPIPGVAGSSFRCWKRLLEGYIMYLIPLGSAFTGVVYLPSGLEF